MKYLLLVLAITTLQGPPTGNDCRAREFRCRLRCEEDTKPASMERIKCYDRCHERQLLCHKYGGDEP